jgi:hypothetical protein
MNASLALGSIANTLDAVDACTRGGTGVGVTVGEGLGVAVGVGEGLGAGVVLGMIVGEGDGMSVGVIILQLGQGSHPLFASANSTPTIRRATSAGKTPINSLLTRRNFKLHQFR